VLTVTATALAAGALVAVSGPLARVFLASHADAGSVTALQPTIAAFAPGLVGYGLVALLSRALYARGLWRAPTVCVAGGWLLAVVADLVLAAALPADRRGTALAAGHSIGVTAAGLALLAVVVRVSGREAVTGLVRTGAPALLAGVLGGAAGLVTARALGADPVPDGGVPAALGTGVVAGVVVVAVAGAVMMGVARRPLLAAVHGLRRAGRQEVAGG
jgi:putative peptidoglycan lipid II flippase